jgi:sortase A
MSGWTLIGAAGLVLVFLVYQLFVTDLINARSQATAAVELEGFLIERRATTTTTGVAPEPELLTEPVVPVGEPLARIEIPKIKLDDVVFEGTERATLKLGPGHMPETPIPGQPGNAVISGHRTTYGRPFYDLDQLVVGDEIRVETALGVNTYEVREVLIVAPTDLWVAESIPGAWLTLTTCHPRFSAAQRLVIQAELVDGPNLDYIQTLLASASLSAG